MIQPLILQNRLRWKMIIPINRAKFHQCESSCPFLQEPLVSQFVFYGEGEAMQEVLNGTYTIPESVDEFTKDYHIQICQSRANTQNHTMISRNATRVMTTRKVGRK